MRAAGRGTAADEERLALMEEAVLRLRQAAEEANVVVEGGRDLEALGWLGIGGAHVAVNTGSSLHDLADDLARRGDPVVVLLDWDRTGGRVAQRLVEMLRGRVPLDEECRRRLSVAFRSSSVEDLPAELTSLRRAVHGSRP